MSWLVIHNYVTVDMDTRHTTKQNDIMTQMKYPHVRLPKKVDQILHILCEDLKNNHFFNSLEKIGFDDLNSRSEFTFFVLDILFKETSDDLANIYLTLLQKHTRKLKDTGRSSLAKRAFKLYVDLIIEYKNQPHVK